MAGLTATQLEQFREDGYLIVEDVLTEANLAALEDEYCGIMDRVSPDLVDQAKAPPRRRDHLLRAVHRGDAATRRHVRPLPAPGHLAAAVRWTRPQPHDERRAGGVRAAHQPAAARHRGIGHRTRDLLQPRPAHPHQATRPPSTGGGPRRQHRRHPVAPGLRRHRRRGRWHRHADRVARGYGCHPRERLPDRRAR